MKRYLAHFDADTNREQTVLEHLEGTAKRASAFAGVFGASAMAYYCAMLHDVGKFSDAFQKRLLENGEKVDHSTAGAYEAALSYNTYAAFCIAGHHGGLPDMGTRLDTEHVGTLRGKLKRRPGVGFPDYSAFRIVVPAVQSPKVQFPFPHKNSFSEMFFTRMLFSCLVDADFLDTEAFMKHQEREHNGYQSLPFLMQKLHKHMAAFPNQERAINKLRSEILDVCMQCARKEQKGLFELTVPTGGGKTLSSAMFALSHGTQHEMDRVIYIIPYTNIIEQTAETFRDVFGAENVLEHHSNTGLDQPDEDGETQIQQNARLATENWDAPIVVTTAVQFFESLFSNKPSRCRRLHNIANSVLIFDEAQMMPVPYLRPCVAAIKELVENYGCSAVLCTATQPALGKFFAPMEIKPIYQNTDKLFDFFRRVCFRRVGELTNEQLAERLVNQKQALCIVNNRIQAQQVYHLLKQEGSFHLSTCMTPAHRKQVLKEIKERLNSEPAQPCRVVATNLVEAGVDLDFPVVYRAMTGLDSILQAAGRCNREGRRPVEESIVAIFDTEARYPIGLEQNIAAAEDVFRRFSDFSTTAAIDAYFQSLFFLKDEEAFDQKKILDATENGTDGNDAPFRLVAERFRLIETNTRTLYIPFETDPAENCKKGKAWPLVEMLRSGYRSRRLMRELGMYAVDLYKEQFDDLLQAGAFEILETGDAILLRDELYDSKTGISLNSAQGRAFIY